MKKHFSIFMHKPQSYSHETFAMWYRHKQNWKAFQFQASEIVKNYLSKPNAALAIQVSEVMPTQGTHMQAMSVHTGPNQSMLMSRKAKNKQATQKDSLCILQKLVQNSIKKNWFLELAGLLQSVKNKETISQEKVTI